MTESAVRNVFRLFVRTAVDLLRFVARAERKHQSRGIELAECERGCEIRLLQEGQGMKGNLVVTCPQILSETEDGNREC